MATKPKYDQELTSALQMIEGIRSSQVGGIQALGSAQDTNISNIYNTLKGGLQEGVKTTEGIYDRGGQNVRNAYALGGDQASAANYSAVERISGNAGRMGMDPRALAEVQGKLSQQAGLYAQRNDQSARERSSTLAQQGAGFSAIAQMAVEAAKHAEARGRSDLSNRIMAEVAKANTTAAQGRLGATQDATNRSARAAADAQQKAESASAELLREQRRMQREEASKDPLDQVIKALRIQQMQQGLDPSDPSNLLKMLNLDEAQGEYDDRHGEKQSDVFEYIRSTFPNQGNKSIPLLQEAWKKGVEAKDDTGMTAREHILKNAGSLNINVLLDMLRRLEEAAGR